MSTCLELYENADETKPFFTKNYNSEWLEHILYLNNTDKLDLNLGELFEMCAQAYRDIKNDEWKSDKKNIKEFADDMWNIFVDGKLGKHGRDVLVTIYTGE